MIAFNRLLPVEYLLSSADTDTDTLYLRFRFLQTFFYTSFRCRQRLQDAVNFTVVQLSLTLDR